MGGLPPNSTSRKTGILGFGGTAMSLYEKIIAVSTVFKLVYDILSDLLRRWKKDSE